MLNIHAISYHNIWPFAGRKLSVFFRNGKYLIKAPIWSGKSFLFFDWPLYGLYKYAHRRMLNIHNKSWYIKIIFSLYDNRYLITRSLTQWKSKESCTSSQYIIHEWDNLHTLFAQYAIVEDHIDIEQVLSENNIWLESLVFKNETDLQQTLDTILPPKEVFTSTMFLLQDSSNIFELIPSERIDILKNIFDLLSIDIAKDHIADKRREIQLQKKILADTQSQDAKLRTSLQQIIQQYKQLANHSQRKILSHHTATINEREILVDKITLQDCSITDQAAVMLDDIHNTLKQQQEKYHSYAHKLQSLQSSIGKQQQKAQQISQEIAQYNMEKEQLTQQIQQAQSPDPATIKTQISTLQSEQDRYIQYIDIDRYQYIINKLRLDPIIESNPLQFAYQTIQSCIQQGKLLTQEKTTVVQQQQTLENRKQEYQKQLDDLQIHPGTISYIQLQQTIAREQESKNKELAAIQREEELLIQQLTDYQNRIKQISARIQQLNTDNPDIADCVKEIQDAINTQDISIIKNITRIVTKYLGDKQLTGLIQELEQAQKQLDTLDYKTKQTVYTIQKQSIQTILDQLKNNPNQVLWDFFAELELKRIQIQAQIDVLEDKNTHQELQDTIQHLDLQTQIIKDFLQANNRKEIQTNYEYYQSHEQEKQILYKQLDAIDKQLQEHQERLHKLQILTTQINQRTQDLQTIQEDVSKEQETLDVFIQAHQDMDVALLQQWEQQAKQIDTGIHSINELVRDHTSNKQKLIALAQEEKILNNLYHIVSKELLLLVLGESLTFLTDIINVYLAQVFSLQLHMEIQKTNGEKVELIAYCEDEKGKREVKSLSGWQKTILKLVWMLAIASYLRAPMLFLDETINNIDADTVSKVADMLTDFVKKHDMKLYTITHSEQIQSMNIWDGIIHVK